MVITSPFFFLALCFAVVGYRWHRKCFCTDHYCLGFLVVVWTCFVWLFCVVFSCVFYSFFHALTGLVLVSWPRDPQKRWMIEFTFPNGVPAGRAGAQTLCAMQFPGLAIRREMDRLAPPL